MIRNPTFLGVLGRRPKLPPPPARTLSLAPTNPGSLGAPPQTVTFTVTATAQTEVKWAVLNADGSAATAWTTIAVADDTATFDATFTATGQRVEVRSADNALSAKSEQVTLANGPAQPGRAPAGALEISPHDPGTIDTANGVATWQTWIGSNVYSSLLYTTVNGAPDFSFRGDWKTIALVNGWALVTASFDTTGQFLKIANPGNTSEQYDSGPVTIGSATTTPDPGLPAPTQLFEFNPVEPGTIEAVNGVAAWDTNIGSNSLTELLWQVFNGPPDYSARGAWNRVSLVDGWAAIKAQFTASGQFVKIADPANEGQSRDSGVVTVPVATPTDPPPPDPGTTPIPGSTPVARLDILCRGQSNLYYAQDAGATDALRDIIAYLTQIPTVTLISRKGESTGDNTIHSGSFSFYNNTNEARWLFGVGNVNPGLWEASDPMTETLLALERFCSTDPNHALLDYRLHWEYDLSVWEDPWYSQYREGTWEITKRIRDKVAKASGRVLTAYAHCSYQGKDRASLGKINESWQQDYNDGTLYIVPAAGNMIDGEARTEWGQDWSHNNDAPLMRQQVRAGVQLSRRIWEIGWCPSGVDLSWVPKIGPKIVSGSRSGSSAFLTVQHAAAAQGGGTNLLPGAAGIDWGRFVIAGLGGATGGAIVDATTIRVDFGGPIPAGAGITHCNDPVMTGGEDGRVVIRDNWHEIRPAASAGVPNIDLYESLLQRTLAPIVLA